MTIDDFVRTVSALAAEYSDHTWIDFDIVPGIAITLLEEFPEIDREVALRRLNFEDPEGWRRSYAEEIQTYFGPRCFVVVEQGGRRRYWNSHSRELVERMEDAIRFDNEKSAAMASERECGPLDGPHKDPRYEGAFVTIERVDYPEWTKCENRP